MECKRFKIMLRINWTISTRIWSNLESPMRCCRKQWNRSMNSWNNSKWRKEKIYWKIENKWGFRILTFQFQTRLTKNIIRRITKILKVKNKLRNRRNKNRVSLWFGMAKCWKKYSLLVSIYLRKNCYQKTK